MAFDWLKNADDDERDEYVTAPQPPAGAAPLSDEQRQRVYQSVLGKYQQARADADQASSQATETGNSDRFMTHIAEAVEDIGRAKSRSRGGAATDSGFYEGLRGTIGQREKSAKDQAAGKLNDTLVEDKLGWEDKTRQNQMGDWAFKDKQEARVQKEWDSADAVAKRESDPNSDESQLAQSLAQRMMPTTNFAGKSAAQLKSSMPTLEKIYQYEQKKREAARQMTGGDFQILPTDNGDGTVGYVRVNKISGQEFPIAHGKGFAPQHGKSPTQIKKQGLADIGEIANNQYNTAVQSGLKQGNFSPTDSKQFIDNSSWAPNWMKSDPAKESRAAADSWIDSYLRDESGAAIPDAERHSYFNTYFPQPGDTSQIVQNKATLRQQKMGNARSAAGGGKAPLPPVRMTAPDGKVYTVPADKVEMAKKNGWAD